MQFFNFEWTEGLNTKYLKWFKTAFTLQVVASAGLLRTKNYHVAVSSPYYTAGVKMEGQRRWRITKISLLHFQGRTRIGHQTTRHRCSSCVRSLRWGRCVYASPCFPKYQGRGHRGSSFIIPVLAWYCFIAREAQQCLCSLTSSRSFDLLTLSNFW